MKRIINRKFKQIEIGEISTGWKKRHLGDLIDTVSETYQFDDRPVCFLNTSDIYNGQVINHILSDVKILPGQAKKSIKKNDFLFSEIRPANRRFALIDFDSSNYVVSTKLMVLRCGKEIIPKYLKYFLTSKDILEELQILAESRSGTFPQITFTQVANLDICLPQLSEQQTIAKILSDLDEKIELNHQMNKTLEAMAQALFKRWFVDFEFPDEKGRPYKSSGGKMVESELGDMPEGWTVCSLGASGSFKNGINYLRSEDGDTEFFIVNVRDIANNKLLLKESLDKIKLNLSKAKEYLLQDKDILIARSACPGEISLVLGNLQNVIYSGFSIRYRLNYIDNYLYIFHIMQGLKRNLQNYSIGTTLQSVNQETLKNMRFVSPSGKVLKEFNKISTLILDKILDNLLQNRELSQIRDSLLPHLMSGRIRVPIGGGEKYGE